VDKKLIKPAGLYALDYLEQQLMLLYVPLTEAAFLELQNSTEQDSTLCKLLT